MRRGMLSMLVVAALLTGAEASAAQQSMADEPLVVVESFLAARNAADPTGATMWCAELLALQDVDGQWFLEPASTRDWLRQLTHKYLIETLSQPVVDDDRVTWTERLTPRREHFPDAWSKAMTVGVHARVSDGRIIELSAPYPPFPIRAP